MAATHPLLAGMDDLLLADPEGAVNYQWVAVRCLPLRDCRVKPMLR